MLVHQILRAKGDGQAVATIAPGETVSQAARILSERRIGALVVCNDAGGPPAGILSERDIVREVGRRGPGALDDHVSAMMTRAIITCDPEDLADSVLTRMTDQRCRHMPVLREGRMIGLISIGDVVKARLDELSMEKEALKGMIMGY